MKINIVPDVLIFFLIVFRFNPVAVSFMTKFLCTICATEKISMGKSELEELAIASGGDMRWAINNLEFKAQGQCKTFYIVILHPTTD